MEQKPSGHGDEDAADLLRLGLTPLRTQARLTTTHSSFCLGHTHCAQWLRATGGQDIMPHHRSVTGHHIMTQAAVTAHRAERGTVAQAGAAQGSPMDGSGNGGNSEGHISAGLKGEGRLCSRRCGLPSLGIGGSGELHNLNSSALSTLGNRQHQRQQDSYRLMLSCGLEACFQPACGEGRFRLRLWGQTGAAALLCLPVWEGRAAQLLPAGPGRASHRQDTRNNSPVEEGSCHCAWGRGAEPGGLSSALQAAWLPGGAEQWG